MVTFDWSTVLALTLAEWKCASMDAGGLSVMMVGVPMMLRWSATNLTTQEVSWGGGDEGEEKGERIMFICLV